VPPWFAFLMPLRNSAEISSVSSSEGANGNYVSRAPSVRSPRFPSFQRVNRLDLRDRLRKGKCCNREHRNTESLEELHDENLSQRG
jgi:hypothetical protein